MSSTEQNLEEDNDPAANVVDLSQSSLLELPDHILNKIFGLVTKNGRQLSLVCKRFHDIVGKMYENRLWYGLSSYDIIIKDERLEKLEAFTKPIENCELRKLRNVQLRHMQEVTCENCDEFWQLMEVQRKFIKNLKLSQDLIDFQVLRKILAHTDNLEELTFYVVSISKQKDQILDLSHLKNLQTFSSDSCYTCEKIDFTKLKFRENSLRNLIFDPANHSGNLTEDLTSILYQQKNLKNVKITRTYTKKFQLSENFLKNTQLESLELGDFLVNSDQVLEEIIEGQKELKKLSLGFKTWPNLIDKIPQTLVKLCISLEKFDLKIFKLEKLRELEVNDCNFSDFCDKFMEIEDENAEVVVKRFKTDSFIPKFRNLESLKLYNCNLPKGTAKLFAEIFPSLKVLKLDELDDLEVVSYIAPKFDCFLEHLAQISHFNVYEHCDMFSDDFSTIDSSKMLPNKNLKILKLRLPTNLSFQNFETMAQSYPNLTELEIFLYNKDEHSSSKELEIILTKFEKIESIYITFAYTSLIDFDIFKIIRSMPATIKFICIKNIGFSKEEFKENLKVLNDRFEEICLYPEPGYRIENLYGLVLAINHTIRNSKKSYLQEPVELSTRGDLMDIFL